MVIPSTDPADDWSRRIFVRYRAAGHLRLELPAAICSPASAHCIETALRRQEGVYRVGLHAGERKLSVFYDAHVCDAGAIARCLQQVLPRLPATDAPPRAKLPPTRRQRRRHVAGHTGSARPRSSRLPPDARCAACCAAWTATRNCRACEAACNRCSRAR